MKKYTQLHILKRLWHGETITRILMNIELSNYSIRGKVVDIGGGRNPNYYRYLAKDSPDVHIEPVDGTISGIDFEKDALPHPDDSVDTVIVCNVLEHIYNYTHLVAEMRRIMKPSAQLIGFVPFWKCYHPDPHDYFRYTHECLERIFKDAGFAKVSVVRVGAGPILSNYENLVLSMPRIIRPLVYVPYKLLDMLFLMFRPKSVVRNPAGFVFHLVK